MTHHRVALPLAGQPVCWSLSRRVSPIMGEIMLELLRKARDGAGSSTEIASHGGIVLEQIFDRPPSSRPAWKRNALPAVNLASNNALTVPLRIGRHWLVLPANFEVPKTNRVSLIISPGMGFGSGQHETTSLCLKFLESIPPPASLLDLGTGSGILAIAAAKRGTPSILAVENDPAALRSARDNAHFNACAKSIRWIRTNLCSWRNKSRFSLVTANLLGPLLVRQAPRIAAWLAPRGQLIASGFLHEERRGVEVGFTRAGLRPVRYARQGRWGATLLRAGKGLPIQARE